MYCPHNLQKRHNIYSILADMHTTDTYPMVVAGDFNATTFDSDRRSHKRTSADSAHREFMQRHNLRPIDGPADAAARTYTFRKASEQYCSRIDDILLNVPLQGECHTFTVPMAGRSSDHDPLIASVPFTTVRQFPPLPAPQTPPSSEPRLLRLTKNVTDALKMQLLAHKGTIMTAYANTQSI
jgi:hypothetical protein